MTDIDIDWVRPFVERYPSATNNYQMDLALRIAEASPALLAQVDELTAELAKTRDELDAIEGSADTLLRHIDHIQARWLTLLPRDVGETLLARAADLNRVLDAKAVAR